MLALRVPSLQHLARNWRDNPLRIKKLLVNLVLNSPTFGYDPLISAVRDMLVFGQPYEQIVEGIRRGIKRPDVRANFLGILPLIKEHFHGVAPDFVQSVDSRYYPVARDLLVPFKPPLIYGVNRRLYLPWFIFWRRNPIVNEKLSLFVSMVEEVLLQDPDMEDAVFQILDFSIPRSNKSRDLAIINVNEVPRVSGNQIDEMLSVFAEGFFLAKAELAAMAAARQQRGKDKDRDDQPSLFDPEH